jgi:hypothetical protein
MRWQDRSVQFEEPQFLSWKIPSLDQQRDRTLSIGVDYDSAFAARHDVSMINCAWGVIRHRKITLQRFWPISRGGFFPCLINKTICFIKKREYISSLAGC